MNPIEIFGLGALVLVIGVGIGYWLGSLGRNKAALKATEAEQALQAYRGEVTAHFNQTAEHFQAIGAEYRKLYEHMSSGAVALCDDSRMSDVLPAAPAAVLVDDATGAEEVQAAAEEDAAADDAEVPDETPAKPDADAVVSEEAAADVDAASQDIAEEPIIDEPPRDYVADQDSVEVAPDPVIIDAEIDEPSDAELIRTEATEELIAERELVTENSDSEKTLH